MMTAEQFYDNVYEGDNGCELFPPEVFTEALKFAEAYAAAQLAEKEREIARLTQDKEFYSQTKAEWKLRAEAAEQRLQEAQARIKELEG